MEQRARGETAVAGRRLEAVLFDLDGTLVDESRSYREAIRKTAEFLLSAAVRPEEVEEIKSLPGFNNDWDATWALVGRRLHGHILRPSEADRGSWAYRRLRDVFQTYYLGDQLWHEISGAEPPFVWAEPLIDRETSLVSAETLRHLVARYKLGIATSRPRVEALMALRRHRLDAAFGEDALVAAEDAPHEKPHPAPLQELMRRLGCRRAVYVGDTINDALAAAAAGLPFILVERLGAPSLAGQVAVRYRVSSVDEIVEICSALGVG